MVKQVYVVEKENHSSDLEVNLQHVSNSTYPKINKLQTKKNKFRN